MIIELPVALLACARIGAIHSVVFGGFSAEAIANRITDSNAKLVITADGGISRGKTGVPERQCGRGPRKLPERGNRGGGEPHRCGHQTESE